MPDMRAIVVVAVPAVTVLIGLLWFLGKKKPPSQKKHVEPPDKTVIEENSTSVNAQQVAGVTANKPRDTTTNCSFQRNEETPKEILEVARMVVETTIESAQTKALKNYASSDDKSKADSQTSSANTEVEEDLVKPLSAGTVSSAGDAGVNKAIMAVSSPVETKAVKESSCLQSEKSEEMLVLNNIEAHNLAIGEEIAEEVVQMSQVSQAHTQCSSANLSLDSKSTDSSQSEIVLEKVISKSSDPEDICLAPAWIQSKNTQLKKPSPEVQAEIKAEVTSVLSSESSNAAFSESQSEQVVQDTSRESVKAPANETVIDAPSVTKGESDVVSNTTENAISVEKYENVNAENVNAESSMSKSWHEEVDADVELNSQPIETIENSQDCDSETVAKVESPRQQNKTVSNGKNASPNRGKKQDMNGVVRDTNRSPKSRSPKSKYPAVGRQTDRQHNDLRNGSDGSSNCDNLSEASNDSTRSGVIDEDRVYEFNIPSELCGLFIGTRGKTVRYLRDQSGANIRLKNNPYTPEYQICVVEGPQPAINLACDLIKRKFPTIKFPGLDSPAIASPIAIVPEIMQLSLPEGVSVDVVVSSIVEAGRIFVQQPTHPSFPSLERLNSCMNQCYIQEGNVPDIPRPIETGVICAAPMLNGWYRAQIMATTETDEVDIKYVDYGGYSRISSLCLKQIRSDFMTLPFEAVECYMANITPLADESYFSVEAAAVLEELTQGKLLQAQVVAHAEDGLPYINLFMLSRNAPPLLVNREMVDRGVVRWLELES